MLIKRFYHYSKILCNNDYKLPLGQWSLNGM